MDEYRVIFNDMGYNFGMVNRYYDELGTDFIVGFEPIVGLKHYPSAVDYNTIIVEAEILEKLFEIAATTLLAEVFNKIFFLAKKSLGIKDKFEQKPNIETHITFIDCKLDIYCMNDIIDFDYEVDDIVDKIKAEIVTNKNVSINFLNSSIDITLQKK